MNATSTSSLAATPAAPAARGFLANVLWADAALCGIVGAASVAGAGALQGLLGLPSTLLAASGLSLLVYAAFAAWLARRGGRPAAAVWAAVAINVVWAVDCLAIAFGPWFSPTLPGQAFLGVQVVTVVVFAELQVIGLRRAGR